MTGVGVHAQTPIVTQPRGTVSLQHGALRGRSARTWFGFGSGETLRDKLADIATRYSVASGVGRRVWREDGGFFGLSAGVGDSHDCFVAPTNIAGAMRDKHGRVELVVGRPELPI